MKFAQAPESSWHLNGPLLLDPRVYTIAGLLPYTYVDAWTHSSNSKDQAKMYIG